jgi:hypothetical protein
MRTPAASLAPLLSALLLAPCACSRRDPAPPVAVAYAQEVAPPVPTPTASARPVVASTEPEPAPTPEEVAAFHAPVPK